MMRNIFIKVVILLSLVISGNAEAHSVKAVREFVDNVGSKTYEILNEKKHKAEEKEELLEELFRETVDIRWMGRFAIGRYWRGLSKEQKADYIELYTEYLVSSYIPNFKRYNQERYEISNIKPGDRNEYLVDTVILFDKNKEYKVSYNVRYDKEKEVFKVFDIIAEGVSLIVTQRSEFGSIVKRNGIDYLNDQLEKKLKLVEEK